MSTTNLYRALRELLPEPPLQVAVVISVISYSGESLIEWPGGAQQRVRGTTVAPGYAAFIRAGVIEGQAPALGAQLIEV